MTAAAPEQDPPWQRLDPRMLLVHPIVEVLRFLPAVIGLFIAGTASGGAPWQYLGIVVPVALGLLRYLTTSFRIAHGRVELKRGLLSRHVLSTPLDRVRTIDLTSSPIHRILGLTTVRIGTGTAASEGEERLDLDGLPVERARAMRTELLGVAVPAGGTGGTGGTGVGGFMQPAPETTLVRLDLAWLRFAPLTSSGLVISAGLLGVGSQLLNELDLWESFDPTDWSLPVPVWAAVVIGVVALGVSVTVLSVVGYLLANWAFALTRGSGSWRVSRGLLTTRETTIDEERLAGVTLGEPLGLRLAGGGRLSAIVTGLSASQVGSAVLAPPAPRAVLDDVAARVLGDAEPVTAALVRHGPAAQRRRFTRALAPTLVVLGAVLLLVLTTSAPWWLLGPAAAGVAVAMLLAVDRVRALGHALVGGYVVGRSGSLYRHRDILAVGHVIGWNLRSTWFQRRVGLTTLVATTAGGRQSVPIPDVPESLAVPLAADSLPDAVAQFCVQA